MSKSSRLTPAERFRVALDLFDAGVELKRQNLRREFPEATESEIDARLQEWLRHRPGAEHGDCTGRPLSWPLEPVEPVE